MTESSSDLPLRKTPLHALHVELGAKMVPFAGYDMPVQYKQGILSEHLHTRSQAGLFDVSHMGQGRLIGAGAAAALEALVPADVQGLEKSRQRYALFTNEQGGILDDLMFSNFGSHIGVVVNAACKEADFAHLRAHLAKGVTVEEFPDRALLALQGPKAALALERIVPGVAAMKFMDTASFDWLGTKLGISRSGYTGEDGFEISVPADKAESLARVLLAEPEVAPIGLGARDSLRLEAGLCLYGHDIDTTTTPIEAGLLWSIPKHRRSVGGFPGDQIIIRQIASGVERKRVGIQPEGRAPAREGAEIVDDAGNTLGVITSGGFSPSLNRPIAMGYVAQSHAAPGTKISLMVRGKALPAAVVAMPFVKQNYHRG
ncbi:MAG: glycine cleavage system aminomethyltransferase GcvT [Rhodospirillales bacterium]